MISSVSSVKSEPLVLQAARPPTVAQLKDPYLATTCDHDALEVLPFPSFPHLIGVTCSQSVLVVPSQFI